MDRQSEGWTNGQMDEHTLLVVVIFVTKKLVLKKIVLLILLAESIIVTKLTTIFANQAIQPNLESVYLRPGLISKLNGDF